MSWLNLLILITLGVIVFKLAQWLYYGFKAGINQASLLEREFGHDVLGAARFTLGLPPQSKTDDTP